jgi:hypothetical protein
MPDSNSLAELQARFTAHIRNPSAVAAPAGIEGRRMKIYNDLVYNNIEGFLSGGFPVLHSLHREEDWHLLVRDFVCNYRCESPYFLEIAQEFLNYLMHTRVATPVDAPFMLELAHYEWVELALDVATETIPARSESMPEEAALDAVPVLSPLVWSLQYRFPVHQIGPGFEPDEAPAEPTYLIVYRNRDDEVKFMESNAATARLLEMLTDNPTGRSSRQLLQQLAGEMNTDSLTPVVEFGARMLSEFQALDIVTGYRLNKQ